MRYSQQLRLPLSLVGALDFHPLREGRKQGALFRQKQDDVDRGPLSTLLVLIQGELRPRSEIGLFSLALVVTNGEAPFAIGFNYVGPKKLPLLQHPALQGALS